MALSFVADRTPARGAATAAAVASPAPFGPVSRRTVNMVVVSLGLLAAVQAGDRAADLTGAAAPWQFMLCYASAITVVAAASWLVNRIV